MARQNNSDRSGNSFSEETKRAVWSKAQIVLGYDSKNKKRFMWCLD